MTEVSTAERWEDDERDKTDPNKFWKAKFGAEFYKAQKSESKRSMLRSHKRSIFSKSFDRCNAIYSSNGGWKRKIGLILSSMGVHIFVTAAPDASLCFFTVFTESSSFLSLTFFIFVYWSQIIKTCQKNCIWLIWQICRSKPTSSFHIHHMVFLPFFLRLIIFLWKRGKSRNRINEISKTKKKV